MSDLPHKFDALKTLYDGQLGTMKSLSERAFSTTMQALALNVTVVAGLMAGKVTLSTDGKVIGTLLVFVFNFLVVSYLVSKFCAHHREKKIFIEIQNSLTEISDISPEYKKSIYPPVWISFFGGTGIFILSVVLAGSCSIFAMWVSLLTPEIK